MTVIIIVFRSGPVQGPGFDRVARINSFILKNQNDVVLVKKKFKGLQPGF
jgi:hypothetical protein